MLSKNLISVTGNMTYRHVKLISVKMKDKAALYRTEQGLVEANLGDLKNQFSLKQKELYHQWVLLKHFLMTITVQPGRCLQTLSINSS